MKLRSQAGQDLFVILMLGDRAQGSFLDIGCCHPVTISNTFALEQAGWRGLLIDNDPGAIELCTLHRKSPVIQGDATRMAWVHLLGNHGLLPMIDYLSLDIDEATLAALKSLPLDVVRFRVITIEHDSYRNDGVPRDAMRQLLHAAGYTLVCADVMHNGCAFEDWYVHPDEVDAARWLPFVGQRRDWRDFFSPAQLSFLAI